MNKNKISFFRNLNIKIQNTHLIKMDNENFALSRTKQGPITTVRSYLL